MSNNNLKTHYSAKELLELSLACLPNTVQGIIYQSKKQGWESKKRVARGGGSEFALSSLPKEVQDEIKFRFAKSLSSEELPTQEQKNAERYLSAAIWQPFDKANNVQKSKAEKKYLAVVAVQNFVDSKTPLMEALELVAKAQNISVGSLKNWYYKVRDFEQSDWLAVLLKRTGKTVKEKADFDIEAWDSFLADYLRPERPSIAACYERLTRAAEEMGWTIPSRQTVQRKVENEVPYEVIVLKRDGENALTKLVPALQRSVADIQAMEWINGDGYQHNVFVKWKNGEIVRPKTWFWQDIRTRKILGYRCDVSENTDSIRYALMDVIYKYGIPRHVTIDNTRAAANKWMTGGVPNRYRFKVKEDDPKGLIPLLGIELHWTSVIAGKGHGQAKPIERAFSHGGVGELVDKDPALAGFYAGANVYDKPDNYNAGKSGVDYDVFMQALARGVEIFNQKQNRKTEICQGIFSFEQVFARDYAKATVRKATQEQLRMLMLTSEKVKIKRNGEFYLDAGGSLFGRKNQYWAESLMGCVHSHVVVRFDPAKLHEKVYVYTLDGVFLAEAICREAKSFNDTEAAREQKRLRTRITKNTKRIAADMELMEANELAQFQPDVKDEEKLSPGVIEMLVTERNTVRKVEVVADEDEEEISEFEKGFFKGVEKLKQQKG
ncbi:TPA: transposase domain-containing protein [Pasteurella multocida]|uniref:transposase domain-containing protein n=1 Tax=Pasteurella multocida TaxID=747 RepID=UPI0038FCFD82